MAIVKRGEKWCVTESDRKTVIKCHPSRKAAIAQLRAIEADKASRKKSADVRMPFKFHLSGKHDQKAHGRSGDGTASVLSSKEAENIIREVSIPGGDIRAEEVVFNSKKDEWMVRGRMVGDFSKSEAKEKFEAGLEDLRSRAGKDNVLVGKIKVSERGTGTSRFISRSVVFGIKIPPPSEQELQDAHDAWKDIIAGAPPRSLRLSRATLKIKFPDSVFAASERLQFHLSGKHDQKAHGKGGKRPPPGQVSFEAQPSTSTNPVPGIQDASFAEKRGYMRDAVGVMGNPETGARDEMLEASGLGAGEPFEVVGVWKGDFNPGMQVEVSEGSSKEDIETYADGVGKTLKQDAVGYHKPFFDGNQANDQGAELELGSSIKKEQIGNLYTELSVEVGADKVDDIALVSSKKGVRALNFSDLPPEQFQQSVANAAGRAFDKDVTMGTFDFDGGLVENDWSANPNGEGYDSKIARGSRDFQQSVDRVNARVGKVNEEWSKKLNPGGQAQKAANERRQEQAARKRGTMTVQAREKSKDKDKDKLRLEGDTGKPEDDKKKSKSKKKPESFDDETKTTKLFMRRLIAALRKLLPETEVNKAVRRARSSAGGEMKKRKSQKAASERLQFDEGYEGMWHQRKSKESVNYDEASTVGEQCSNCRFFLGGACRLVEGTIFPEDVCDLFEEKVAFFSEELVDLCSGPRCNSEFVLFNELSEFSEPPEWIPFLPKPGEYNSPKYGDIIITRERNEHFIENFDKGIYQEALPISSEHMDDQEGAYGWIEEMRLNDDGSVDARVKWTDRGKEAIEKDRFRYFSPEFHDVYKDNKGQKHRDVAVGGALTTRPFFKEDELRPLVASEGMLTFSEGDHSIQFTTAPKAQKGKTTMQTSQKGGSGAGASNEPGRFKKFAEGLVGWMKKFGEEEGIDLDGLDDIEGSLEGSGEGDGAGEGDGDGTPAGSTKGSGLGDGAGDGDGDGTPKQASERIAALEAENAKLKASEKANTDRLKKADERIGRLEANEDRERFMELVAPRDNPDARWFGDTEAHIKHLMALKKAFGEDSNEFKHYVSQNKATVVATNTAGLFDERGHRFGADAGGEDESTPAGAYAKLREHASELQEFKDGKITMEQAIVKASELHPELKQVYRKQFRSRETVR